MPEHRTQVFKQRGEHRTQMYINNVVYVSHYVLKVRKERAVQRPRQSTATHVEMRANEERELC